MELIRRPIRRLRAVSRTFDLVASVFERSNQLHGHQMAGAITLMAFLSLLPLLVLGIALLGFWSAASDDLTSRLIDALGLTGSSAADTLRDAVESAEASRRTATVVGLIGLLWTGLGLVSALQYTWNVAWQVQGRGLRDRLVALLWICGGGLLVAVSIGMTVLTRFAPAGIELLTLLAACATSAALFLWTAWLLPNRDVGWRPLIGPAMVGALGFEVLKVIGTFMVPRMIARASALYGSLGVIFALLTWLLVLGRLIVYVAVLEVVLWERRHGTTSGSIDFPALPATELVDVNRAGERSARPAAAAVDLPVGGT